MVLGPDQAREAQAKRDAPLLATLEARIDTLIMQTQRIDTGVYIDYAMFSGVSPAGAETLLNRYRQAGWGVQLTSDQRDGSFYTLTPARSLQQDR